MYTIGQVSEMFNLPVSTLRYYDKEGFFPNLVRKGNIRYFSHNEIEALHVIECLKKSGLGIKEINQEVMFTNLRNNQILIGLHLTGNGVCLDLDGNVCK